MKLGQSALVAYLVFLVGYAFYKYSVAAPDTFSPEYLRSVAILVTMTGVAPFVFTYGLLKLLPLRRFGASVAGLLFGMIFCIIGYALFWYFFIVPYGAAPAVYDVALRGVGWGLLQGGLAAIIANH